MISLRFLLSGLVALVIASAAGAQENAQAPAGTGGLSLGQERQPGPGDVYVAETHSDWQLRCVIVEEGQTEPCHIYQLLTDPEGFPVAEVSIFRIPQQEGSQIAAGGTFITPLGTLLTANLGLEIDAMPAKTYPFSWCDELGCIARVGFTADEVNAMRRGMKAVVTIYALQTPDSAIPVVLDISLRGFTAGFAALENRS